MITLRYIDDGEVQPDPIHVLWTVPDQTGEHVSLITGYPGAAYLIVRHSFPFVDGGEFRDDGNFPGDLDIQLSRPDAGQLAVALITALIEGSDEIISSYIEEMMSARDRARQAIADGIAAGRLVRTPNGIISNVVTP